LWGKGGEKERLFDRQRALFVELLSYRRGGKYSTKGGKNVLDSVRNGRTLFKGEDSSRKRDKARLKKMGKKGEKKKQQAAGKGSPHNKKTKGKRY